MHPVRNCRSSSFDASSHRLLPYVHVLDLAGDGHIKPHVDSARFCGDTVAVLRRGAHGRFYSEVKSDLQLVMQTHLLVNLTSMFQV